MSKIGALKVNILHNLAESYIAGDKNKVKDILKILKENKDFRELYLFYEEIEGMYLKTEDHPEIFVESFERLLKDKSKKVEEFCKSITKRLPKAEVNEVEVYNYLDILSEDDTFKNIDKKISARKKLIEHLTKEKEINESTNKFTSNENLLNFVLVDRFNNNFDQMLSEEDKTKLSEILTMSLNDLENNFKSLKEEVTLKLDKMITECQDNSELKSKLNSVQKESEELKPTKYNYYKLQQLKNGL